MRDISYIVVPIRDHAFFKQPVLESQIGNAFFQGARLPTQVLHFAAGGRTGSIASKPALSSFHEVLGPGVIEALGDALVAAQLGNAGLVTVLRRSPERFMLATGDRRDDEA